MTTPGEDPEIAVPEVDVRRGGAADADGSETDGSDAAGSDADGYDTNGSDSDGYDAEVRQPRASALNTLLVVAAILFAWDVYAAIGNLVQVPGQFDAYRDFVTKGGAPELAKSTPWVALVAALIIPVVGYLAALRLSRGRRLRSRVILFVIAYAAVSALTVSLTAYVFQVSSI